MIPLSGPSYKKSIDQVGEVLCDKLEFLRVDRIEISPLKLLAVQIEVRSNHEIDTKSEFGRNLQHNFFSFLADHL